jgi:hypothetical protein
MIQETIINRLLHLLKKSDNKWIIRKRVIDTSLLFKIMSKIIVNSKGIKHTLCIDYSYNHLTLSDAAVCKARSKCDSSIFTDIKNSLIDEFSKDSNVYAVDGSKIRLPPKFSNYGFTTRDRKSHHILGMISCLFDVYNKIPIHTKLFKHYNERTAAIEHFTQVKKGSILIFDRGYFSENMVQTLKDHKLKFLFRIKSSSNVKMTKFFESKSKDKIIVYKGHRIRLFKYSVNSTTFVCATNIFNETIAHLQHLYKLRWTVEDGFKVFKSNLDLKHIHSKTLKLLKQEIVIRELLFTVTKLIKNTLSVSCDIKKRNILSLDLIIDSFVNNFKIWIDDIKHICQIIIKCQFTECFNRTRKKLK